MLLWVLRGVASLEAEAADLHHKVQMLQEELVKVHVTFCALCGVSTYYIL